MSVAIEKTDALSPDVHTSRRPASRKLEETLQQHREWLESRGEAGKQADLSGAHLEGADLTDANLKFALMNRAVLRGADLLLADLRGASLLQADLRETNLLGTNLQEAILEGANLDGATGLLSNQLAGADVFGTTLPATISGAEALKQVKTLATKAGWLVTALLCINGLAWLRIVLTSDLQLLTNAPVLPIRALRNLSPLGPFFLIWPILVFGLYLWLHLNLQHLWDAAAALPAILSDGRRLDRSIPWFARWPLRSQFRSLRERRPRLATLDTTLSIFLLYWVVPATMLFFWGRYLTAQDFRGSMLHVILLTALIGAAIYFADAAGKAFETRTPRARSMDMLREIKHHLRRASIPLACGFLLVLLSLGAIFGAPHYNSRAPGAGTRGIPTWSASILWLFGYSPYAQLTETDVSLKPANWTGQGSDLQQVKGAALNGASLRYAQAYGAFFAKARMWQADLGRAYMPEADLRSANLRQASLQSAILEGAKLNAAVLEEAGLQGANLTRTDLRDANLSHAVAAAAIFTDAKMDGAILYGTVLRNAVMQRASLAKADLRAANLENANLGMADLREAYLSSAKMMGANLQQTQLGQAILTDADLRRADLSNANLQGAVLANADIRGANLQSADLRGAVGVSAAQICSTVNTRQAQMDDLLQTQVDAQCGANR